MNKNVLRIAVCLTLLLNACKGKKGNQVVTKDVKPSGTAIQGYLRDYLEVVDGNYQATRDNSTIFSWSVKVKIKAKKSFAGVDYGLKDGNNGPLKLDLFDDKGSPITGLDNMESSFEDDSKLLDILSKGIGEVWITFKKFNQHNGMEQLPENTASFSINSEQKESGSSISPAAGNEESSSGVHILKGAISTYPVEMKLKVEGSEATGTIRYTKFSSTFNIKGKMDDTNLSLDEYEEKGAKTGSYKGKWLNGVYEGQWTNAKESKLLNFKLIEQKQQTADNSESNAGGSQNFEQLMNDYEQYVDQYVEVMKKVKNNEANALAEYPAFYEKAIKLQSSIEKARKDNNLRPEQMTRFIKIQGKLLKAAQALQ